MKKHIKTAAALLLCVLFAGCLSVGVFAEEADQPGMGDLESWHMDTVMEYSMTMDMAGEVTEVTAEMTMSGDIALVPDLRCRLEICSSSAGETVKVLTYYEQVDDAYMLYMSADDGENWVTQTIDGSELPSSANTSLESFALLMDYAKEFPETGTETVNGFETSVHTGVLEGEDMVEFCKAVGLDSSLASLAGTEFDSLDLSDLGSMEVTIYIDGETGMLVRYSEDLTDFMQHLMDQVLMSSLQSAAADAGLPEGFDFSALGFSVTVHDIVGTTDLYDFNAVDEIVMPEIG